MKCCQLCGSDSKTSQTFDFAQTCNACSGQLKLEVWWIESLENKIYFSNANHELAVYFVGVRHLVYKNIFLDIEPNQVINKLQAILLLA